MATGIPVTVGELVDVATINSWARGYLRKTTAKTVNTTTTATDLLNGEFTIPAGALSTDRILRLTAWGDWKNATTLNYDIPRFQLLLGGTTIFDTDNTHVAVTAHTSTRFNWRIQCEIQNLGAANSQWSTFGGRLIFPSAVAGAASAAFITGEGVTEAGASAAGIATYDGGNSSAVDTTAACALALKVINDNGGANYETKLYGALVEII